MSVFRLPSSCRLILALSLVLLPAAPVAARMVTTSPPGYRDAFAALESGSLSTAQGVMARGGDPVLNKVLRGALMARPGNDYSFDDLAGFVTDNPDWPGLNGILMIAEQKIPSSATPDQIVNWFTAHPPLTAPGFVRFTDALDALGQGTKAAGYVRGRWVTRDFSSDELAAFYARYAPVLTSREHNARLDRLLWANNITAAQAMYSYVDSGQRALAEARFSLANQLSNAEG
ncbi:MAG: hypothetical protein HGA90_05970, partial [Alphaproteobacteria bacterium]|nr:hypothetical protein [Alphaproteobacteria bacterium]